MSSGELHAHANAYFRIGAFVCALFFCEEQKFSPTNFCAAIWGGLGAVGTGTRISQWQAEISNVLLG